MKCLDLARRQCLHLCSVYKNESEMTRRNACYALNAVGTPTVDALRDALKDSREYVRNNAAEGTRRLGK